MLASPTGVSLGVLEEQEQHLDRPTERLSGQETGNNAQREESVIVRVIRAQCGVE